MKVLELFAGTRSIGKAFRAADADSVRMLITSSNVSPVILVPMEGEEFIFLLLPMRLK